MMTARDRRLLIIIRNALNAALTPDPALAPAQSVTSLSNDERVYDLIYSAPRGLTRSELCRKSYWLGDQERTPIVNRLIKTGRVTATEYQSGGGRNYVTLTANPNPNPNPTQGNPDNVNSSI